MILPIVVMLSGITTLGVASVILVTKRLSTLHAVRGPAAMKAVAGNRRRHLRDHPCFFGVDFH